VALVVLAWCALAVAAYLVAVLLAPTTNADGQCTGIGWGCRPDPQSTLILAGMFLGVPVGVGVLVGSGVLGRVLVTRSRRGPVLLGTLAFFGGVSLGVVLAIVFVLVMNLVG
jgi:hypothetical protein